MKLLKSHQLPVFESDDGSASWVIEIADRVYHHIAWNVEDGWKGYRIEGDDRMKVRKLSPSCTATLVANYELRFKNWRRAEVR